MNERKIDESNSFESTIREIGEMVDDKRVDQPIWGRRMNRPTVGASIQDE